MDRLIRKDLAPLGHLGDAEFYNAVRRPAADVAAFPLHGTTPRPMYSAKETHQRRFARAVGADQRDRLIADLEGDRVQDIGGAVGKADINRPENGALPCRDKPRSHEHLAAPRSVPRLR